MPGPSRSGAPAPSWSRTCTRTTAAPAAHTKARSSPTAASTARRHLARCSSSRPLPPAASSEQAAAHDQQAAEPARHKLGRHAADGYHRVTCPATAGKIRCPLRPDSMPLSRDRPEILTPPGHPPACRAQQTITVPPGVAAKTRQKHDYPSPQWRRSYRRRTAAERVNATIKDTATTSISRGWCRLMGLAPLALWIACLLAVRNQRILTAWDARQDDNARRAAAGLPPRTRKRRRQTLATLAAGPP
ncbi:MAG TPA: hypothetical protein VIV12_13080 [Streptosporangiaceae bacterium]